MARGRKEGEISNTASNLCNLTRVADMRTTSMNYQEV